MIDMTNVFSFTEEELDIFRAGARKTVLGAGVPLPDADEIVDLSLHMSQEALRAAERVASSIPEGRVMIAASTIAFSLLHQRFHYLEERSREFAEKRGLATVSALVQAPARAAS